MLCWKYCEKSCVVDVDYNKLVALMKKKAPRVLSYDRVTGSNIPKKLPYFFKYAYSINDNIILQQWTEYW